MAFMVIALNGLITCSCGAVKYMEKEGQVTFKDLAYFDIWKHEDGTWQKGIKPGSKVGQTYIISESMVPEGAVILQVTGGFDSGYGGSYGLYAVGEAQVKDISYEVDVGSAKMEKNADLGYRVTTTLKTSSGSSYGMNIKESWQASKVEGYRYFIPVEFTIKYKIVKEVQEPEPGAEPEPEPEPEEPVVVPPEVTGEAVLNLPEFTYEGHPADALDYSEFQVDGEYFSASRAYRQGIARNSYQAQGGTVKKCGYDAQVTFPEKGIYPVSLRVSLLATGERLWDTKSIEVRKTPYIEGGLFGVQKQNRAQNLHFSIATYPGKPVTAWKAVIRDEEGGEVCCLTGENGESPGFSGSCIKTRSGKLQADNQYFSTLDLDFLTKYPAYKETGSCSRRFYYSLEVWDSKGDRDFKEDWFQVEPDMPPEAGIECADSFIREKDSDIAVISCSDATVTDGDQIIRSWRVAEHSPVDDKRGEFRDAESLQAYRNLSFENNHSIAWEKRGVGRITIELAVRDSWVEPTLPEFVVPEDVLSAVATRVVTVENTAPVLSLTPVESMKTSLNIVATGEDMKRVKEAAGQISQGLAEAFIDGDVNLIEAYEQQFETGLGQGSCAYTFSGQSRVGGGMTSGYKRSYVIYDPGEGEREQKLELRAYDNQISGKKVWSYVFETTYMPQAVLAATQDEGFLVFQGQMNWPDKSKYQNYLRVFDGERGSLLFSEARDSIKFSAAFTDRNRTRIYLAGSGGIYELSRIGGSLRRLTSHQVYLPRMYRGMLGFVGQTPAGGIYLGYMNLETGEIKRNMLPAMVAPGNTENQPLKIMGWRGDGGVAAIRGDMVLVGNAHTRKVCWSRIGSNGLAFFPAGEEENGDMVGASWTTTTWGSKTGTHYHGNFRLLSVNREGGEMEVLATYYQGGKSKKSHFPSAGLYLRSQGKVYLQETNMTATTWVYDMATGSLQEAGKLLGTNPWLEEVEKIGDRILYHFNDVWGSSVYKSASSLKLSRTYEQSAWENFETYGKSPEGSFLVINYRVNSDLKRLQEYCRSTGGQYLFWDGDLRDLGTAIRSLLKPDSFVERPGLTYRKGELVSYDINYYDYEGDPKKQREGSYWIYAQEPYNDGELPEAGIILDEEDRAVKICGMPVCYAAGLLGLEADSDGKVSCEKAVDMALALGGLKEEHRRYILSENISRFYTDGRYRVAHLAYDDTSRGRVAGGYPNYDKLSEPASLTFYVEGTATAPWITGISTSPEKVKEGQFFSINIGMDDLEKDRLDLSCRVYADGREIIAFRKKGIEPVNGVYPVVNTGALPEAARAGKYQVVCSVRDQTGTGMGEYSFVVTAEGRVEGMVKHTESWEEARKRYNAARFGQSVDMVYSLKDYTSQGQPPKRGANVFWPGEAFLLSAAVSGTPERVTCSLQGTVFKAALKNTGQKNQRGEALYEGQIWDRTFKNRFGLKKPEELTFLFEAWYSDRIKKTSICKVIVDNRDSYLKLHRMY